MAHNFHNAHPHLSQPRNIVLILIAIGAVVALAVASGFAYSMHEKSQDRAAIRAAEAAVESNNPEPVQADESKTNQEKVEPMPTPQPTPDTTSTPGSSNHSSSNTRVTVNGQSVTVNGTGSMHKSYTSNDGKTKVEIKINNRQESH